MQAYSCKAREADPHALPDAEVFYVGAKEARENADAALRDGDEYAPMTESGWYWWACFPGCMPDSDARGPFGSEAEALADAQDCECQACCFLSDEELE